MENVPCLECLWTDATYRLLGDNRSCSRDAEIKVPMMVTTAAIVAGLATQLIVDSVVYTQRVLYNYLYYKYMGENRDTVASCPLVLRPLLPKDNCDGHLKLPDKENISLEFDRTSRIRDIKRSVKEYFSADDVELTCSGFDLIYLLQCNECGYQDELSKPKLFLEYSAKKCPRCGKDKFVPYEPTNLLKQDRLNGEKYTLEDFPIPSGHVFEVVYSIGDKLHYDYACVS